MKRRMLCSVPTENGTQCPSHRSAVWTRQQRYVPGCPLVWMFCDKILKNKMRLDFNTMLLGDSAVQSIAGISVVDD